MVKYATHFELVMGLRPDRFYVVDYKDGTKGVYLNRYTGFRNQFGTGLAVRGSRGEVELLLRDHGQAEAE